MFSSEYRTSLLIVAQCFLRLHAMRVRDLRCFIFACYKQNRMVP